MGKKAANQNTNDNLFDDYTPPTPEERGDFVDDEPLEDEQTTELEEDLDTEELEDDEPEQDDNDDDEEEDDEATDEGDSDEDEPAEEDEDEHNDKAKRASKGDKGAKKRRVPLDRLNKEIEKRRAAEAELERLRNAAPAPKAEESAPAKEAVSGYTREDFEEMQEAMLDGETDKAFEVFGKILASQTQAVQAKAEAEVAERVRSELNQDRAMSELQRTAAEIAESYPELDSTGDEADQGLIEEVVEMRDLYVDRGLSPAEALKKSVRIVALENELEDRKAKPKASIAAPVKRTNTKKKLEAAKREKGKLPGSGGNNARPDIDLAKLSADAFDEAFANLSAEAKARR